MKSKNLNELGVANLDYYCIDNYIDCDALTRSKCQNSINDKQFIEFLMINNDKTTLISFRADWLFTAMKDIGYACFEDFTNSYWNSDVIELYEMCKENESLFKIKY